MTPPGIAGFGNDKTSFSSVEERDATHTATNGLIA